MSCIKCCFMSQKSPTKPTHRRRTNNSQQKRSIRNPSPPNTGVDNVKALKFTFQELEAATRNFQPQYLIGEGGFGRVYKGMLPNGQIVAVKQLDGDGMQGNREFTVEVLMLSLIRHENLVNLVGYCADGDQRLLVYEYMPMGSLADHLLHLEEHQTPLSWRTRMNIALGAAKGLEYLHDAKPPIIYRDFKCANILLDKKMIPKLSDFGLSKFGPMGDTTHVSTRVMGTYGYCAPEYQLTGQLTMKSDVYSFGVVLLELITGRKVIDMMRPNKEQNLVIWAQPMFKGPRRHSELADLSLKGEIPKRGLNQAVAVAAMCLHEMADVRPLMGDVVSSLNFLWKVGCHCDTSTGDVSSSMLEKMEETVKERGEAVVEAIAWASRTTLPNTN